jgi:hypothetical protein
MGLLDFLNSDDARLGIGLLAAGGYTPTKQSFGQRVATAFAGEDARKQEALKAQMLLAQIDAAKQKAEMDRLQQPLLLAGIQANVAKTQAEAEKEARLNKFYSPENTAQFSKPAYEEVLPGPGGMGPTRPAGPPIFDLQRMTEAAAKSGAVSPEALLTHQGNLMMRRSSLESQDQARQDALTQRYFQSDQASQDRKAALDAAAERARESQASADERARQALELRRDMFAAQRSKDLKPGERYNEQGQVEVIPNSAEWTRRANLHAKDYQSLLAVDTKTDNFMRKIDSVLDPKNKSAFESNFGGYNALATRWLPGDAQDVRTTIESLKSDMKNAGLEMMRAGGSIGQMTEREWPIVEKAISNIDPMMSEKKAMEELRAVRDHLERIRRQAKDVYETEWKQQPQFFRGDKSSGVTEKVTTQREIADVALRTGKTVEQVTRDAKLKGYVVK